MGIQKDDDNPQFLTGGGEMGRLTSEKDWSKTSLGAMQFWPQSLRTTLSIILNSKFPMFLWWGPELICFYNDAYRPSLGQNGKHPSILGMKAEEAWTEIWHIIKPLINQVLSGGESIWSEDQLIPIYRNGKIEDVYWTFSYSPVNDESGKPAGVLVTCTETTSKIITLRELEESKNELEFAIDATELGTWDYNPITNKFSANERLKKWFGLPSNEQVELSHAINAIHESDRQRVITAIQKALDFSSGGNYDIEYAIIHPGTKKETNVRAKGRAWFNEDKIVYRFNGTLEDVTEQTIANRKAAQFEQNIRNMILDAPIGICVLDASTLISETVNDSFIEVAGKPYEAIAGKFYWDVFTEAKPYYEAALEKVVKNGIPFYANEVELTLVRHGIKENVFVTFVYAPIRNINGEVNKVAVWVVDNTQQVMARQEIQKGVDKLNVVIEASDLGTFELDLITDSIDCSERFNQIFGYENEENISHAQFLAQLHPDDVFIRNEAFKKALQTGTLHYQSRVFTGDALIKWIEVKGQIFFDEQHNPKMLLGTCRDITEEKKRIQEHQFFSDELEKQVQQRTIELIESNKLLKDSEERYHLMVEEVQDYAILYLNREGIVENWNTGAEKIKGYKASEIIGKSFSNFYTEEDRKNNLPQKLLERAAQTGRARQEGWRVRKDGSLFWASVVITAVHNEKNDVIGFSKVTHDLTEKKDADDKLKKTASELEQKNIVLEKMNKELQSFAYISSHDLQEPLRKIQTFAGRLLETEHSNLTDNGKDQFKRMQNAAERMQTLIDDLLAYSRTNSAEKKYEKTDLNKIVEQVEAELKEELQQKCATIEAIDLCEVNIIPFQFRQILHNLISNALKFSNPGQPLLIRIKSEIAYGIDLKNDQLSDTAKYCHISISDNGIGFEQQYSEKIFELFQRLHSRMEYHGTGIGLAIVKKIIENHDGIITATGELNKGATFDIYIPAINQPFF